jgi:hypothetical protein
MEVYIITLLLIFVLGVLDLRLKLTDFQRNFCIGILYIIIVIQIGLRWETGTDWKPYLENFETTDDYSIVLINSLTGFEIGYGTFVFFIKKLFDSYSFFLFIHAIIFYAIVFKIAKKYSPYFFISLLFFYATNLGVVGSNRQLLAVVLCLLSIPFVIYRKPVKFFAIIVLASLFHTTAILFGIYYFFNKNLKWYLVLSFLLLAFIIGKTSLPVKLFSLAGGIGEMASSKVEAYGGGAKDALNEASLSFFGLLKRILFLIMFTFNMKYLSGKLSYYKILYNGYAFGLFLYFLFSSSLIIIVNRGSLYFNIMESFLISSQFLVIGSRSEKAYLLFVLLIISVLFLIQSISSYPDLFDPYKSLFYNQDFYREMY